MNDRITRRHNIINQIRGVLRSTPPREPIILNQTIRDFLKSRQPYFIKSDDGQDVVIAPLNAVPIVTDPSIPRFSPTSNQLQSAIYSVDNTRPDNYRLDKDSPVASLILPPQTQYTCGCCWAVSVATSVSDGFVVTGAIRKQILMSWTELLSCSPSCKDASKCSTSAVVDSATYQPSLQCGGGNFTSAALWVKNKGIIQSLCMCYSWCSQSEKCKKGGGKTELESNPISLNSIIPACTSCITGCGMKDGLSFDSTSRFFLKDVISEYLDDKEQQDPSAISDHIAIVKDWILKKGSVVAGYVVFSNFISSKTFIDSQLNPDGVYLEAVDYSGSSQKRASKQWDVAGAHAVSIIGYCLSPVHWTLATTNRNDPAYTIDDKGMTMIPCWIVRNSWGPSWNRDGYFRIAMYPYNKSSQLDALVTITSGGVSYQAGGMIFLDTGVIDFVPPDATVNKNALNSSDIIDASRVRRNKELISQPPASQPPASQPPAVVSSKEDVKKDSSPTVVPIDDKEKSTTGGGLSTTWKIVITLLIIVIAAFIATMIYKNYKNKQQEQPASQPAAVSGYWPSSWQNYRTRWRQYWTQYWRTHPHGSPSYPRHSGYRPGQT